MTHGKGLLLVMTDVDEPYDQEFNDWHAEEHGAERLSVPGIRRVLRFEAAEGEPRYLALYELDDVSVLESPAYRHFMDEGKTERSRAIEPHFKNFKRNVYTLISERKK